MMTLACFPSYWEGEGRRIRSSTTALAKSVKLS
jgi:hypothetical protein